jgi:hypothetical protein
MSRSPGFTGMGGAVFPGRRFQQAHGRRNRNAGQMVTLSGVGQGGLTPPARRPGESTDAFSGLPLHPLALGKRLTGGRFLSQREAVRAGRFDLPLRQPENGTQSGIARVPACLAMLR